METDRGLRWFERILTGSMVVLGLVAVVFGVVLVSGTGQVRLPADVSGPYEITFPGGRVIDVDDDGGTTRAGFPALEDDDGAPAPRIVVETPIEDDDIDARVAMGLSLLGVIALTAVALVELRRVVRSARDGEPFDAANVGRIRHVAYVVLTLPIVFQVATWIVDGSLDSALDLRVQNIGGGFWGAVFLGVGLLALAQVFRAGVALRELEQGTV